MVLRFVNRSTIKVVWWIGFLRRPILHSCFKCEVIRSHVTKLLLRNRALVNYAEFFCAPCRKKPCVGSKNDGTFLDRLDVLYHHAKFGEDRNTRAGCWCENMVFCTMFFFLRPERCSLEGDIVRTSIVWRFIGRYWWGFHRFFQTGSTFQMQYMILSFITRWRYKFREIAVKDWEESKNRRKSLCAPLRIDSWRIWKKSTAVV